MNPCPGSRGVRFASLKHTCAGSYPVGHKRRACVPSFLTFPRRAGQANGREYWRSFFLQTTIINVSGQNILMKALIFSLLLVILFLGFSLNASAGIWEKIPRYISYGQVSYHNNNVNISATYVNPRYAPKPWMVYASALARSPSPSISSKPPAYSSSYSYHSNFYPGNCYFTSRAQPYGFNPVRAGYLYCP